MAEIIVLELKESSLSRKNFFFELLVKERLKENLKTLLVCECC